MGCFACFGVFASLAPVCKSAAADFADDPTDRERKSGCGRSLCRQTATGICIGTLLFFLSGSCLFLTRFLYFEDTLLRLFRPRSILSLRLRKERRSLTNPASSAERFNLPTYLPELPAYPIDALPESQRRTKPKSTSVQLISGIK